MDENHTSKSPFLWQLGLILIAIDIVLRISRGSNWTEEISVVQMILSEGLLGIYAAVLSRLLGSHFIGIIGLIMFIVGMLRRIPKKNPGMRFHGAMVYAIVPLHFLMKVFLLVLYIAENDMTSLLAVYDLIPDCISITILVSSEFLLLRRSRNGVRLYLINNGAFFVLYMLDYILLLQLSPESVEHITLWYFIPNPAFTLLVWLYYRTRFHLFYDTQICLNCFQRVKDIEPICPHCGQRWNDPELDLDQESEPDTPVAMAQPTRPIQPQQLSKPAPPHEDPPKSNLSTRVALGLLVAVAALCALYWLVFISGFVISKRDTVPVERISASSPTTTPRPHPTSSPSPMPAPDYSYLDDGADYEPLSMGDTGPLVESVQRALIATGYLDGVPDGIYGPATQKAIRAFQDKHLPGESEYATPRTIAYLLLGPGKDEFIEIFDPSMYPTDDPVIYFAPFSGRFYHSDPDCEALENSLQIAAASLDYALEQNLAPCPTCGDDVEETPEFNWNAWAGFR